ncbi:MAG: MATE family efflux transporter [Phycisphaerales bacterium JB037]
MTKQDPHHDGVGHRPDLSEAVVPGLAPECSDGVALTEAREDGHPLREMFRIALPSVVTMTSYTVMQFIDAWMVSRITPSDPVHVPAQGNGGIMVWVVASLTLGLLMVVNTFVSQNLGAGTPQRAPRYAWSALWLSLVSVLWFVPAAFVVPSVFAASGHPPEQVVLETQYAQILFFGAVLLCAGRGMHQFFYGLHRAGIVLKAVLIGNLVNLGANWVLIYGNLGAPAMGVPGAAVATVIGQVFELAIPLAVFLGPKLNAELGTRSAWKPDVGAIKDLLRIGWPAGLMMVNEILCWSYLMSYLVPRAGRAAAEAAGKSAEAIEQAGVLANEAGWIALRYMHASFMPTVGLSIAVTALVGKCMGMRRPDLAAQRAWLGLKIAMIYMGLWALAFVFFGGELLSVFVPAGESPERVEALLAIGVPIMIAAAVFQLFDAVAITMSGALRGTGDTVWPGVMTVILSWACVVGGGVLMIEVAPQLGSLGPWIAASAYIVLLGVLFLGRFTRGKWRSIELLGRSSGGEAGSGGAEILPLNRTESEQIGARALEPDASAS